MFIQIIDIHSKSKESGIEIIAVVGGKKPGIKSILQ